MEMYQLQQKQSLPLEAKVILSKQRIKEWYREFKGQVYVAFSGGKDSTVLLHLVRSLYPDVEAVFVDTGLEYPEIKDFVKTIDNVTWLKPKKSFLQVIKEYGYPVVSKVVSMGVDRYCNTKSELQKELRLNGGINPTSGKKQNRSIPIKWHHLIDAPFKISDRCCDIMKKEPFRRYENSTGKKPFIGTMASESENRKLQYLKNGGCNAFNLKKPKSMPLSIWNDNDIWDYIKKYDLNYSSIYDMGEKRTGCMFCMFGVHMEEKGDTRFDRMKKTHPKIYEYCMNVLGMKDVLRLLEWRK